MKSLCSVGALLLFTCDMEFEWNFAKAFFPMRHLNLPQSPRQERSGPSTALLFFLAETEGKCKAASVSGRTKTKAFLQFQFVLPGLRWKRRMTKFAMQGLDGKYLNREKKINFHLSICKLHQITSWITLNCSIERKIAESSGKTFSLAWRSQNAF